jgi:hypothetical protein
MSVILSLADAKTGAGGSRIALCSADLRSPPTASPSRIEGGSEKQKLTNQAWCGISDDDS